MRRGLLRHGHVARYNVIAIHMLFKSSKPAAAGGTQHCIVRGGGRRCQEECFSISVLPNTHTCSSVQRRWSSPPPGSACPAGGTQHCIVRGGGQALPRGVLHHLRSTRHAHVQFGTTEMVQPSFWQRLPAPADAGGAQHCVAHGEAGDARMSASPSPFYQARIRAVRYTGDGAALLLAAPPFPIVRGTCYFND